MQSVESYYHPANIGKHSLKLTEFMARLSDTFVKRVHKERYKKPIWGLVPSKENTLSDSDITEFVKSLQQIVFHAMWSRWGVMDAGATLADLSTLRPELILPTLVDRLYAALETVTEPHKLTASLYSVLSVARCLVQKSKFYTDGQTHVLPLLFSVLPGIDANDMRKSMITFQYISTFASLVPFVDCSDYTENFPDLTEDEKKICFQTAQFEDFLVEFLNRCFSIVENSEVQQIRSETSMDDTNISREDTMKDVGMASTFSAILMQCSEKLYDVALKKVSSWINGKIMEWKVSGKIAASLCRCLTKIRPTKGLAQLMPIVLNALNQVVTEGIKSEDNLNDEIKFLLMLLSEIIRVPGKYLLPYVSRIDALLTSLIEHSSKEGIILIGSVLRNSLRSLSQICPVEYKSIIAGYDRDLTSYVPIRDWGKPGDVNNLQIEWYIPGHQEVEAAQDLVNKVLSTQFKKIEEHVNNGKTLNREELAFSISCISDVILGAGTLLFPWTEKFLELKKSQVDLLHTHHTAFPGDQPQISLKGVNTRLQIFNTIHKLLIFQLSNNADDTKSLTLIANVYNSLLFFTGVPKTEYDNRWKSFQAIKKAMANKLLGSKKLIRAILIDRTHLQHESRVLENSNKNFTETHKTIYEDLLLLATNHYSEVRIKGQEVLSRGIKHFSHSYHLLVPRLLELLQKTDEVSHEQFKGALYVILGVQGKSLLTKHSWEMFSQLCPAVIRASHSEKPSIIKVFSALIDVVVHNLDTLTITFALPNDVVTQALNLWNCIEEDKGLKKTIYPTDSKPIEHEITNGETIMQENNKKTEKTYFDIVLNLCSQLESGLLHWRHYNAGVSVLATLTRYDKMMPVEMVKIIVNNLVHDNLIVRKTSIHNMAALLRQHKRAHVKIERKIENKEVSVSPGNRSDNQWLQYNKENWPNTEEQWNQPNFVHKTHFGYYHWPEVMMVYGPDSMQPKLDRSLEEMTKEEQEIFKFLYDDKNMEKLITFLSLEENKGKDKFDSRRFLMWKGIFRNFGYSALEKLIPSIEKLCDDQLESSQRCAAEILAGLIRGCKHWNWQMSQKMWSWLVPVLRKLLGNVTVETIRDWGTCFATASESRDPNRIHWLLEVLMEEPLRSQGSFLDSSRLYVLQGAMAQQEWRIGALLHQLDKFLTPYLTHPYQNVRERLGSVVANIYAMDITFSQGPGGSQSPSVANLLSQVIPKLDVMKVEPDQELYNFHKNANKTLEITPEIFESICMKLDPELSKRVRDEGLDHLQDIVSKFPEGKVPKPPAGPNAGVMMPGPSNRMPPPSEMLRMIPPEMIRMRLPPPGALQQAPPDLQNMLKMMGNGRLPGMPSGLRLGMSPRGPPPIEYLLPPPLLHALSEVIKPDEKDSELDEKWNERQSGVRLLQTMCKLIAGVLLRNWYTIKPEIFQLLEMLALNENSELEPDLAQDCNLALACLATCILPSDVISTALTAIENVSNSASWKAKNAILEFLQIIVFWNFASFKSDSMAENRVTDIVKRLIKDERVEVREKASKVLGGLIHCSFISLDSSKKLMEQFKQEITKKIRKKPKENEDMVTFQNNQTKAILRRHSGVLGLSAFVHSCPYDIPEHLPDILMILADHLHDPQPIPATVKNVFQEFKRTHQDNWAEHKQKLTEDQLTVLTDLLVSPSYYA